MSLRMQIQILTVVSFIIFSLVLVIESKKIKKEDCQGNNHYIYGCECLQFTITPQLTWHAAKKACMLRGGQLAIIQDSDKQNFIANTFSSICDKNGAWIGLFQDKSKNTYVWGDGKRVENGYSNWAPNEPDDYVIDQRCVNMHKEENWRWKNAFCTWTYSYICQYDLECPACGCQSDNMQSEYVNTAVKIGLGSVGGVAGLILIVIVVVKCYGKDSQHSRRYPELRQVDVVEMVDRRVSEPMLAPPLERPVLAKSLSNDLEQPTMMVASEVTATSHSPPPRYTYTQRDRKVSNISAEDQQMKADNNRNEQISARRSSDVSLEDNNAIAANIDTGDSKDYTAHKL